MPDYDVFFYEAFAEEAQALRAVLPPDMVAGFTAQTIQEHGGDQAPPCGVISTRTQSVLPPAWAEQLQAVLTRSTGYDHVLAWQRQTGSAAQCGYLPLYCARAVAEQAAMLWLALLRRLPRQQRQFDNFDRDNLTGAEAAGKTLAVFGVGNIGSELVRIGRGLDMQVLGVDLVERHPEVNYVTRQQALAEADVLVCAMNLTPANAGYFNYAQLRQARPGLIFVNIARGELSPPSALLQLLEEQHLGGVGLDVFANESSLAVALRRGQSPASPELQAVLDMARHDNVILTPHNAFNTGEAVARKAAQSIVQLQQLRATGTFKWPLA